jgi:hypothetical protein
VSGTFGVAYHAICASIDDARLDAQKAHTRNEFWLHRIDALMRAAGLQGNAPLAHDPNGELPKLLADLPASDRSELNQQSTDLRELERFATGPPSVGRRTRGNSERVADLALGELT